MFTHLHNHSEYSLLDGMTTPDEMMKLAAEYGQTSMAVTDHGTCGGWLKFQEAGKKYGVKPIFGVEAYFTEDIVEDKADKRAERFHLILLAKNQEGMENILRLQKKSWTEGFYYKPRTDWRMLEENSGGIIVLSGCMGGIVSRAILDGDSSRAESLFDKLNKTFEDFYCEIQPWNPPELNAALLELAVSLDVKPVGTIDCHYPTHQHKDIEEVLLCVGQYPSFNAATTNFVKENWRAAKKRHPTDLLDRLNFLYPGRKLSFQEHDTYVMSQTEVESAFISAGIPEVTTYMLVDNTMEVAEKCNSSLVTGQKLLPKYHKKYDSFEYLKELAEFRLDELGLAAKGEPYTSRLQEELDVIDKLDFSDYFLVIWDLVNWAKGSNIYVGAGRGSAAGSLLSYVLGITDIDPIEHNLIFWRFINPDRLDYPDIDLDFEDRRRREVKDYLRKRWGAENVAAIATYGEFKSKSVVKDVGRVLGLPLDEANNITKLFNSTEELFHAKGKGLDALVEFRREWPEIIRVAEILSDVDGRGRIRQTGAHAAGMVVSSKPLDTIVPVETRDDKNSEEGRVHVVAFDMDDCQKMGLIKLDALGLNTLSVVHDAIDAIKNRHDVDVSRVSIQLNDDAVFHEFSEANTVGIFQTESSAYKHLLRDMGIDNFNDLAASNALVRPGALLTQTDTYINRKQGRQKTTYLHPILEEITKDTYGTFVYQEQIMETVVKLAGFNWRESDTLRKIIGKKRDSHEFDQYRQKFIDGASEHIKKSQAEKMWEDFVLFSGYAFNKSHAVSYSQLSYQTMWLKIYYPLEFMWALLRNEQDKQNISTYLLEATRLGIDILPPDINESEERFSLQGNSIRFGLSNVGGVGPSAIKELLAKRPFSTVEEVTGRCKKSIIKAPVLTALDKVGALGNLSDHISGYDHRKYYFKLLSWPVDMDQHTEFDDRMTPCGHFVDNPKDVGVIKAIVRSTKRTPTYFRVEFEDSTGAITYFAEQNDVIDQGDFMIAMVGNKTVYNYIDVYSLGEDENDPFYQFLLDDGLSEYKEFCYQHDIADFSGDKALCKIVGIREFMTKTGKPMGSMLCWDGNEYRSFVIFPQQYAANVLRLKKWNTVVIKQEYLQKDGGWTIMRDKGMLTIEELRRLKGA